MLGVLLQRPRHRIEIVNDLDSRIAAWWRAVRDHPDELARMIAATPWSREIYCEALGEVDAADDPVRVGWAVHTILMQSIRSSLNSGPSEWVRKVRGAWNSVASAEVDRLAERLANVQLDQCDAADLITRLAGEGDALLYVDPPYRDRDREYGIDFDYDGSQDRLADALLSCQGRVAVSGYGDEWDRLGWERHTKEVPLTFGDGRTTEGHTRVEVLWCNYEQPQGSLF